MKKDDEVSERTLKTMNSVVLAAIHEAQPVHGWGLSQAISDRTDGDLKLNEATIYPILRILEREGFIKGDWHTPENGVPRKLFVITEKGLEELGQKTPMLERLSKALAAYFGGRDSESRT